MRKTNNTPEYQREYRQRKKEAGDKETRVFVPKSKLPTLDQFIEALEGGPGTRADAAKQLLEGQMAGLEALFAEMGSREWGEPGSEKYRLLTSTVCNLLKTLPPSQVLSIIRNHDSELAFDLDLTAVSVADGTISMASGYQYASRIPGFDFESFTLKVEQYKQELAGMAELPEEA